MNRPILAQRLSTQSWRGQRACADCPAEWFTRPTRAQEREAKAVCDVCPVKTDCLVHALQYREVGIWGGTNEAERRRISRQVAIPVPVSSDTTLDDYVVA